MTSKRSLVQSQRRPPPMRIQNLTILLLFPAFLVLINLLFYFASKFAPSDNAIAFGLGSVGFMLFSIISVGALSVYVPLSLAYLAIQKLQGKSVTGVASFLLGIISLVLGYVVLGNSSLLTFADQLTRFLYRILP